MKSVLACDLGGTNLRMAVITHRGEVIRRTHRSTPRTETGNEILETIKQMADETLASVPEGIEVTGVGAAVPATVDFTSGLMLKAPNLPSLDGFPMRMALGERFGLPAVLENDANAALLGESWLGASRGFADVVTVTLGTGVGGGIMISGNLVRGIDGTAGEIGHICVEPDGVRCGCGSQGCVEQYASATAVARLWNDFHDLTPATPTGEFAGAASAADVFAEAAKGNQIALKVFGAMGSYLGIALADIVNVLNPQAIVIGGGLANAWDYFIGSVRAEIERRAFREPATRVALLKATLGDDAGLLGITKISVESHS